MSNSDLPVPQGLVAGKYRVTRMLGRGGMGAVWEGTHNSLGTRVAVKFIDAEYAESPEARSRFENEARAAARLRSKHVVEVYDHGVSEDGRPFIVMEYLHGEPLDKRLDRVGRLPAKETAHLMLQVCRALTKAHAANVVHRDLKPENIFLVWDDEEGTDIVKVVDFGIAKFTDASLGASSSSTRTGSVLGTPHYMSPEQARGLRSVDYRSDLWSVAVIAYRCIVGQLPFDGEAVGDLLVKLCTAPIPVPSQLVAGIPPSFDAWLAKALNRDPAQRFTSAAELGESLAAVCGLSLRGQITGNELQGSGAAQALGSGSRAAFGSGPSAGFQSGLAASATGAPISKTSSGQTPAPRSRASALIAAALAALVVLGIGGAVAVKKLTAPADAAARPTPDPVVAAPPPMAAAPPPAAAPRPVVEQAPAATAAATIAAAPVAASASAAISPSLPKPKPAANPGVNRPAVVTPAPVKPLPVVKPSNGDIGF